MGIEQILRSDDDSLPADEQIRLLNQENETAETVIGSTQRKLDTMMRTVNEKLARWKATVTMELSIRVLLNKFEAANDTMTCQGWCPTKSIDKVQDAVEAACRGKGVG